MSTRPDRFEPYVPRVAAEWDLEAPGNKWRQVKGSLVFVDISGFTSLSERLARKGRIGAEELTSVLNRVFGAMLDAAFERGGSLLKFGGDALLLLFGSEGHVMQACAAVVEMRSALRDAAKEPTSVGRINLRMSSGVHTGSVDFFLVGDSHRELIVAGPTASITTEMEGTADAGEIMVSDPVRDHLPNDFIGDAKGDGWLLRKRKINHPTIGTTPRISFSDKELSTFVPDALREHLGVGVTDSEHRIATVGFVKFKGIDALLEERGPERVSNELDRLVTTVQEAVDTEGITFLATDVEADGGKIILVAGVPSSQHDDEGRMLRVARQILDTDLGLPLQIGINRGHVFSGNVGSAKRSTYTVMGDTVNLAARFMATAPPGSLYASPSVLDLSSTLFRTEALEPFHVKGKQQPVQAYEVHEETGTRTSETSRDLPFTGRDAELEMIVTIVTTCAQEGRGGMMTITGDTGTGKSRLLTEVRERCPGLGTLMVQAEPNGADNPYWAFRDPLRKVLNIPRGTQFEMADDLVAAVNRIAPDFAWAVPLLGDLLHIEVSDTKETAAIDPQFRPDRTADVLIDLLSALYSGPFAVLAEDGHWMDDASIHLLRRIGAAAESRPWTVIFTARREDSDFQPLGDEIALRPLDDDDVRSIAIEVTAAAPLRPHELDAVVSRASGNPLFLSEILSVIRETGSAEDLPESLDAVVSSEIDTLPPLTRQLLRYGSVLGRSFRRTVLDEFLAPEPMQLDEATQKDLERFIEADGETRLRFRHAVVHDIAYEGLSYRRRRELHARAGDVIERLAGDDPVAVAEFLATHYSLSGAHDKAWYYSYIAAEKAKHAYANTEAAAHFRRAIDAARHMPGLDSGVVADVWKSLGEVRELTGQFEGAREAYGRAIRGDRRDPGRLVDLHLLRAGAWMNTGQLSQAKRNVTLGRKRLGSEDQKTRTMLLARLDAYEASIHMASGDFARAHSCASSAAARAISTGEDEALARAYQVLDGANFMLGHDEPRRGEEAIEILRGLGLLERSVGVMNNMGAYAYLEGEWDRAVEWYRKSLEAAELSGNVVEAALTRANIAEVLIGQRRYHEATPLLEQAERTYIASNSTRDLPLVRLLSARVHLGTGEIDEAIEKMQTLLDAQLDGENTAWTGETAISLADAQNAAECPTEALKMLDKFEKAVPDGVEEVAAAMARVRGQALELQGHPLDALEAFDEGLRLVEVAHDLYQEALIREARATMQSRAGDEPDPADISRLDRILTLLGVVTPQLA